MKKFLVILSIIISSTMLNAVSFKADVLTGDTKLACEAILCLSSGTRPSECYPSINRYFSIHKKHWSDTVNARRNFLRLCPVGEADKEDKVFADLRDNVLPNVEADQCTAEYLNNHPETNCVKENCGEHHCTCIEYEYRPRTKLFGFCYALYNHQYTNVKPKNVCGETGWYSSNDWHKGESSVEISETKYNELKNKGFKTLKAVKSGSKFCKKNHRFNYNFCNTYYKLEPIKKDCWVNP